MQNHIYCGELDSVNMPLDGVTLIEAAAGTGKTYNIQNIVARLIVEKNFPVNTLVIVTFTNKAAKELAGRLRKMLELLTDVLNGNSSAPADEQDRASQLLKHFTELGITSEIQKERLEDALHNIDNCQVATIHGFCLNLLKEYAFESSMTFSTQLQKNIDVYRQKLLKDFCRSKCHSPLDLPQYTDLTPNAISYDVDLLLKNPRAELTYQCDLFENDDQLLEHLEKFHNCFAAIERKSEVIEHLRNKINSINSIKGNLYIDQAIKALQTLKGPAGINWRSWYEVIKLFRKTNFIDRGQKGRNGKNSFYEYVNNYVCTEELFTVSEEYCNVVEKNSLLSLKLQAVKYISEKLEDWKIQDNFLTFDDLLSKTEEALKNDDFCKLLQHKFNAGIIDEFQDTDPLQYNIFKMLFIQRQEPRIFMVGDPRQAIYSFRGGDMATYLRARRECIEYNGKVYTLNINYRSSGAMIDTFNEVFGKHPDPFSTDEIRFEKVIKPSKIKPGIKLNGEEIKFPLSVQFSGKNDPNAVFKQCAEEISKMLASNKFEIPDKDGVYRKITPGDIAVLADENKHLDRIRMELARYNIPAIGERKGGIWGSTEAADLALFMTAVLDNFNKTLLNEVLVSNIGAIDIAELNTDDESTAEKLLEWYKRFIDLAQCWNEKGTASFMEQLIRVFELKEKLPVIPGGERNLTNYIHLGDLLAAAELEKKLSPQGVLNFLQEKISSNADEEYELLESDRRAVRLLTIHKSKGLQFPIVFLPQFSARYPFKIGKDGFKLYHNAEGVQCCDIDKSSAEIILASGLEEHQENMRLVYVAITRACYFCRITWDSYNAEKPHTMNWLFANYIPKCSQDAQARENLRLAFVGKRINFSPDTLEIPQIMQHDEFFCDFTAANYMPQLSGELIEPKKVPTPSCSRYIISYSTLNEISKHTENPAGTDEFSDREDSDDDIFTVQDKELSESAVTAENNKTEKLSGGIWDIPHGAAVGNAWHEILEKTDFTAGVDDDLLKNIMASYSFKKPEYLADSAEMFRRLLEYKLPCGMHLKDLPNSRRLTELEFMLSAPEGFSFNKILSSVNEYLHEEFGATVSADGFLNMHKGFFTGFVDMIFEYENKLYIVDWKSNALGCLKESFSGDALKKQMFKKFYPLQYLCYLAALLKYLEHRLQRKVDEITYNKYVAGVYYIFLRGMMLDEPDGVFSAEVPYKTVRALADVITCGKGE